MVGNAGKTAGVCKRLRLQNTATANHLHMAENMTALQRTRDFGRILSKNFEAYVAG